MTALFRRAKRVGKRLLGRQQPQQPQTYISLDSPAPGQTVYRFSPIAFYGWAYSPQGDVSQVQVFIDNVHLGQLNITIPRPDVAEYLGLSQTPVVGFHEFLRLGDLAPGHYTLRMVASDASGYEFTQTQPLTVMENPIQFSLDAPQPNTTIRTPLPEFSGWAFSTAGALTEIRFYLDAIELAVINNGIPRPDLVASSGQAALANAGFFHTVPLGDLREAHGLPAGDYTLSVVISDEAGSQRVHDQQVTLIGHPLFMAVDQPTPWAVHLNNHMEIIGWAFSEIGLIDNIAIYLGENHLADVEPDERRPDLVQPYGEIAASRAGFRLKLETDDLPPGTHVLKFVVQDTAGHRQIHEQGLTLVENPIQFRLDTPEEDDIIRSNVLELSGEAYSEDGEIEWIRAYLNDSKRPAAEIYAMPQTTDDDNLAKTGKPGKIHKTRNKGSLTKMGKPGKTRSKAALSGVGKTKQSWDDADLEDDLETETDAGTFEGQIWLDDLLPGQHTLKLVIQEKDGFQYTHKVPFMLVAQAVRLILDDAPQDGDEIKTNLIEISGCTYSEAREVTQLDVFVDDILINAMFTEETPARKPRAGRYLKEFDEMIWLDDLESGRHELRLMATDSLGYQFTVRRTFYIPEDRMKMYLDQPPPGFVSRSNVLELSGWVFSEADELKHVRAFIDDTRIAEFLPNTARPDVQAAYSGIESGLIGFSTIAWLDDHDFEPGDHILRLVAEDLAGNEVLRRHPIVISDNPVDLNVGELGEESRVKDNVLRLRSHAHSETAPITSVEVFIRKVTDDAPSKDAPSKDENAAH